MNITLSIDQFIPRCIYFGEPVQNTIMENSRFIKLIYSNELVIMNGLYFEIPLNISHKATYFRRNKYFFDMNNSISQRIIKRAQDIEYAILKKYSENRQSIFSRSSEHDRIPLKHMKPMVFATTDRIISLPHRSRKNFSVYIRKKDVKRAVYVCTVSKLNRLVNAENNANTVISSRVCSKIK